MVCFAWGLEKLGVAGQGRGSRGGRPYPLYGDYLPANPKPKIRIPEPPAKIFNFAISKI